MNGSFLSGGLNLARFLVQPSGKSGALPAMVLCHGFPSGGIDSRQSGGTFPELAEWYGTLVVDQSMPVVNLNDGRITHFETGTYPYSPAKII